MLQNNPSRCFRRLNPLRIRFKGKKNTHTHNEKLFPITQSKKNSHQAIFSFGSGYGTEIG